jgi:hypothetical protein
MTNQPAQIGPPAAWYDDPEDDASMRYWDGATWTEHRAPKRRDTGEPSGVEPVPGHSTAWPWSRMIAAAGAVAIIVGSVSPWASVSAGFMSEEIRGTEGDGMLTVIGGIVVLGMVYTRKYLSGLLFAIVAALTLLSDLSNIAEFAGADDSYGMVSVGWGLYLASAGSVATVVTLVMLWRAERARTRAAKHQSEPS